MKREKECKCLHLEKEKGRGTQSEERPPSRIIRRKKGEKETKMKQHGDQKVTSWRQHSYNTETKK